MDRDRDEAGGRHSGPQAAGGELQAAWSRPFLEALDKSSLLNPEDLQQSQLCAICSLNMQVSQDVSELLPTEEAPWRGERGTVEAVPQSHCQPCHWQLPRETQNNAVPSEARAGQTDISQGPLETKRLCCRSLLNGAPLGDDGIAGFRMPCPHPGSRTGEQHNLAQEALTLVGCLQPELLRDATMARRHCCGGCAPEESSGKPGSQHMAQAHGAWVVWALQEEVGSAMDNWEAKHLASDRGPLPGCPGSRDSGCHLFHPWRALAACSHWPGLCWE